MAEITETENDHDDDDAGPQPRVTDAPMEIWLQYGDELLVNTPHSVLARDGEVSWCDSQVFPFDVKYVRADEVERLREQWADAEARNVTLATVQRERDELRARVAELEAALFDAVSSMQEYRVKARAFRNYLVSEIADRTEGENSEIRHATAESRINQFEADHAAATRRAIVRAAAEIGRQMTSEQREEPQLDQTSSLS